MRNKTLVRAIINDVYNNRDLSQLPTYCVEDYRFHDSLASTSTLADLRRHFEAYREAFSDSHFIVDAQTSDGELVATRLIAIATHTGPFMGHPATGRKLHLTGIQVDRIRGGRFVETWVQMDYIAAVQTLVRLPHIEIPRIRTSELMAAW